VCLQHGPMSGPSHARRLDMAPEVAACPPHLSQRLNFGTERNDAKCHKRTHALQQTKCMAQCFIAIPISVQLVIEFVPTLAGVGVLWDLSTGLRQLGAVKTTVANTARTEP
jgi:hypothetical protein